ncbi:J domain-containing protein [Flavobacteriaceae bacterium S0825]|uniref:J domain-containing protein n=1 Tax=Gaetbulibacter sp. S0825 TaxID=2720084 RepID=UPI0014300F0A|nr:J domain-containing protein [Gaetbulibacter sp. S0825]MCK0109262.1 J domain-containing protein [Flavobacteriaceae bacterium S0825]NIX64897.1 DnaJ domain-containing protein [Gaetbulibacter sp. S0825]
MTIKNYYNILKVEPNSDLETIKKAFRKEIAIYHPENNKTEEAKSKFDDIIEAFDVLSIPEKRKAFDEILNNQKKNTPVVLEQKQEEQYKDWHKEAKKKSKKYRKTTLTDILALDLLLNVDVVGGLLSETDNLIDGLSDSIGDILDIF